MYILHNIPHELLCTLNSLSALNKKQLLKTSQLYQIDENTVNGLTTPIISAII